MSLLRQIPSIPAKFPLLIFVISAGVSVWASYDPAGAWVKFVWLLMGVAIYFALAIWPTHRMKLAGGIIAGLGTSIAAYFLLTGDWNQSPADLGIINQLGLLWMRLHPRLSNMPMFHPNIAGGLIAAFIPINLAAVLMAHKRRRRRMLALAVIGLGISAFGLFMASSRAAWLSVVIGLALWFWWFASQWMEERVPFKRTVIFGVPVLLALLVVAIFAWLRFGDLLNLANTLPGAASAGSRVEIAWNALHLSRAFPFTGGGLASFAGLYSRYMRVIPVYEYGYAHNLYLDILVEQGIFGLGAFLWTAIISLALVWDAIRRNIELAAPVLAGLVVLLLHGFFDDAFYGMSGTPLLLILPGLAAAFAVQKAQVSKSPGFNPITLILPVFLSGAALLLIGLIPTARASLYTNLGAVQMAKLQLTGWPDVPWHDPFLADAAHPAQAQFILALQENPTHVPALYRLGIMALEEFDFITAAEYLEKAHALAPGHIGIQKNLGYCQLWQGNIEAAADHLGDLPGIREELDYYSWWWATKERQDLSAYAAQLIQWLQGNSSNGQ